jgi:O-antigen/teichoic acid export membrane protein
MLQNIFRTSIINYIGVAVSFVTILFIQTKILTEDEIGVIRLILDKSSLVLPFFLFGLHSVASRFYFHFEDNKSDYSSFMTLLLGAPIIIFSIGFIISLLLNLNFRISNFYLIAVVLLFSIYIRIFEEYLATKQKIIFPSLLRNILFKLLFVVFIFLYYYCFINFKQLLVCYVGVYLMHLFLLLIYFRKNLTFKLELNVKDFNKPIFKEIATYCLFFISLAGSITLVTKLDTIMLEAITNSLAFVGIYAIAFSISNVVDVVKRPIVKLSMPILSKKLKENKLTEILSIYRKSSINLMIAGSFMFLLVWLNIDLIFSIIPNSEIYQAGKYAVFFLCLAKLFDLSLGVNYEIIQGSIYYKWNILLTPFLAVLSIVLNLYFISKYSLLGAAIATAVSVFTYNILRTMLISVKLKMHPFTKKYFKVIPFVVIPFIINYFFTIENLFFNLCYNILILFFAFILPIYLLKLSDEFNYVVDIILVRLKIKKLKSIDE